MSRSVNLTDKLGLGEKPTIIIGDVVLTVDDSADVMLRVFELIGAGDGVSVENIMRVSELLFDGPSRKALKKLSLSFVDYTKVVEAAIDLIIGSAEGNAQTQDTTS